MVTSLCKPGFDPCVWDPFVFFSWRVPDISSGSGRAATDTVSSPLPPHPGLGQPFVSSWTSPHLVQLPSLWWLPPVSLALSGHWDTGKSETSLPNFLQNLMLHHISQRLFGKNCICPWSEWEVPTEEAVDLKLHWVYRNLKEAGFCLFFDEEVATRIVKSPLIQLGFIMKPSYSWILILFFINSNTKQCLTF